MFNTPYAFYMHVIKTFPDETSNLSRQPNETFINWRERINTIYSRIHNSPQWTNFCDSICYPRSRKHVNTFIEEINNFYDYGFNKPSFSILCKRCHSFSYNTNFFSDFCDFCEQNLCKFCENNFIFQGIWSISLNHYLTLPICSFCAQNDYNVRIIQRFWRRYKNRQQKWKMEVIYNFIDKIIHHPVVTHNLTNKGALTHALSESNYFDLQLVTKMQNVINVFN